MRVLRVKYAGSKTKVQARGRNSEIKSFPGMAIP